MCIRDRGTTEGINISGGTFTDQVNEAINFDSGRTRISGGTFEKGLVSGKKATVTVTGGTFAADPLKDGFVADGYVVKPGDKGAFEMCIRDRRSAEREEPLRQTGTAIPCCACASCSRGPTSLAKARETRSAAPEPSLNSRACPSGSATRFPTPPRP